MTEAFIYDAVRTPRGKGRSSGALHGTTPIQLAITALQALRDRNQLDTALVDDVILGCVEPAAEQGANIARVAVITAGYDQSVAGVQVNRYCASGLEACNMAAAKVMSGQSPLAIGGGVDGAYPHQRRAVAQGYAGFQPARAGQGPGRHSDPHFLWPGQLRVGHRADPVRHGVPEPAVPDRAAHAGC